MAPVGVTVGGPTVLAAMSEKGGGGVLAQSIGGSGGAAGSVTSKGVGFLGMTIGGGGGTGGLGAKVTIDSAGLITTYGSHASGLLAQSIGGGGNAGFAVSTIGGIVPTVAVAVGGNGAADGSADLARISNEGQVTTYGGDAARLKAQSIGGGGGSGGAGTATAVDVSPSQNVPAVSVSFASGGAGGEGNTGGQASVTNSGLVITAGHSAFGSLAQSVGGGGGIGGASSATGSESDDTRYEFSLAAGGVGAAAGNGGGISITHTGLVQTAGVGAFGIVGQSVGGGGGHGGASGDANSSALSFGVSLGGGGGATGSGGPVTIQLCQQFAVGCQAGSVSTTGKHAVGILAQSVGGGGGLIRTMSLDQQGDQSGSSSSDAPDDHNMTLDFGQKGTTGASGSGGLVTANIAGSVTTTGRNAHGVAAFGIGGGGGAVGGSVINLIQRAENARRLVR